MMNMKKNGLTPKQQCFCDEYLIDLNATQAAIRAGYSVKTANEQGNRLLANVSIKSYLQKRAKDRETRTAVTQDKVLNELAKIAFSNSTDFVNIVTKSCMKEIRDKEGNLIEEKEVFFKDVEIEETKNLTQDKKDVIASIKQGANGIEVKLHDKVKALELVGRHLGMFTDKIQAQITSDNTNININAQEIMSLPEEERQKYIDDLAKIAKGE